MLYHLWFVLDFKIGGRWAGVNRSTMRQFFGLRSYLGCYRG